MRSLYSQFPVLIAAAALVLCAAGAALAAGPRHHGTAPPEDTPFAAAGPRVSSEAEAAYNLGMKYQRAGQRADAVQWFRKAAVLDHAVAQSLLGEAYESGSGIKKNDKEAFGWFARAAAQGVPQAQYHLGRMYAKGRGVKRDDKLAAKWYRLAADRDIGGAQHELGLMCLTGRGVARDDIDAYFWLTLAARQVDAAMEKRDSVEKRMTPRQLAAARFLVKSWQPVK